MTSRIVGILTSYTSLRGSVSRDPLGRVQTFNFIQVCTLAPPVPLALPPSLSQRHPPTHECRSARRIFSHASGRLTSAHSGSILEVCDEGGMDLGDGREGQGGRGREDGAPTQGRLWRCGGGNCSEGRHVGEGGEAERSAAIRQTLRSVLTWPLEWAEGLFPKQFGHWRL